MNNSTVLDCLRSRMLAPLPGWDAQVRMAPDGGRGRQLLPGANDRVRRSAVLLLLHEAGALAMEDRSTSIAATSSDVHVLLTVRSRRLNHHGGQISLPGGGIDPGEDARQAAMREACEEVGIDRDRIDCLGDLTPLYIPVSRNIVHPILAVHRGDAGLRLQASEVEEAFSIPLRTLQDDASVRWQTRTIKGHEIRFPYWDVHHEVPLWGATAMILSELLAMCSFDV